MEKALRALVGSTVLSGQPLIREARQRQLINFDQANSLAEFQATRDRVHDSGYKPTEADLNAARAAFLKLDTALTTDASGDVTRPIAASAPASGPIQTGTPPMADAGPVKVVGPPSRFPAWMIATAAVAVVAVIGLLIWRPWSGGSSALEQGIDAYRKGQR